MGSLAHFNVRDLAEHYGCTVFIETGTGTGDSLQHAFSTGCFAMLASAEIDIRLWRRVQDRFRGHADTYTLHGSSKTVIRDLLPLVQGRSVLWWLDAHFPGADYGLAEYEAEADATLRIPLQDELALIKGRPGGSEKDVILIDDARLFLDDRPWSAGPLEDKYKVLVPPRLRNGAWIEALWCGTHAMAIDYADQGYIALTPSHED